MVCKKLQSSLSNIPLCSVLIWKLWHNHFLLLNHPPFIFIKAFYEHKGSWFDTTLAYIHKTHCYLNIEFPFVVRIYGGNPLWHECSCLCPRAAECCANASMWWLVFFVVLWQGSYACAPYDCSPVRFASPSAKVCTYFPFALFNHVTNECRGPIHLLLAPW